MALTERQKARRAERRGARNRPSVFLQFGRLMMIKSPRDTQSKLQIDLVACLGGIHPKERMKAIAAALLEIERREKRRPFAEQRDSH